MYCTNECFLLINCGGKHIKHQNIYQSINLSIYLSIYLCKCTKGNQVSKVKEGMHATYNLSWKIYIYSTLYFVVLYGKKRAIGRQVV